MLRTITGLTLAMLASAALPLSSAQRSPAPATLLAGATLIGGTGGTARPKHDVLVVGGRIAATRSDRKITRPSSSH